MLTGSLISAGGSLLGGLFGNSASKDYVKALKQAQDYLKGQEQEGIQNYSPFLNAGTNAVNTLGDLMSSPGAGLLKNWTGQFTAPTAAEAEATPGYQFQLKAGMDALQNSAAGKGNLLSGRTMADLNNYAQGVASTNYQNVFNNAFTQYQSAYNSFLNNQNNTFSRLMGLSGMGMNAAQGDAGLISNIGGDIASLMGQQGAASAQGKMALGNGISGLLSNIGGGFTMNGLMNSPSFSGSTSLFADPGMNILQPSYMPGGGTGMMPPSPFGPGMGDMSSFPISALMQ